MNRSVKQSPITSIVFLLLGKDLALAQESSDVVPRARQYKIKPDQKARLTAAGVVGPVGLVYPNWARCGAQGEIPASKIVVRTEDCDGPK